MEVDAIYCVRCSSGFIKQNSIEEHCKPRSCHEQYESDEFVYSPRLMKCTKDACNTVQANIMQLALHFREVHDAKRDFDIAYSYFEKCPKCRNNGMDVLRLNGVTYDEDVLVINDVSVPEVEQAGYTEALSKGFFLSPIVSVSVGGSETAFFIYRDVLCQASPFFSRALNGDFDEARSNRVNLPEDRYEAFLVFANWIHGQNDILPVNSDCTLLVQAWILADKLLVPKLQNRLMGLLVSCTEQLTPGHLPINLIYENTLTQSKLRVFALQRYVQQIKANTLSEDWHALPEEFQKELSVGLLDSSLQPDIFDVRRCYISVESQAGPN